MKCNICSENLTKDQIRRVKKYGNTERKFCSRICSGKYFRNKRKKRKPTSERFLEKVEKLENGCWQWNGATIPKGYGRIGFYDEIKQKHVTGYAHRWSYEYYKGKIPSGLTIDHLCKNTSCVNPEHLEVVTLKENIMRSESPSSIAAKQTHCIHGHPFDEENTYYWNGERRCRACGRERWRRKNSN